MKLKRKFLQGGAMPAGEGAPAPQGSEDPTAMLLNGAQLALQNKDCQIAMQVCLMLLELAGGAAAAPQEPAAPMPAEEGEPVYRRGGRLIRRIKQ